MSAGLDPLLAHTVALVAHPDDEAVGCGALLQRAREPLVIFATDGAPYDPYFWKRYGSREAYAAVRRAEVERALGAIGVRYAFLTRGGGNPIIDQELFRTLPEAWSSLRELLEQERPAALVTSAYEGGHPDHDACCFLGALAARELRIPVWEMPLYHRSVDGVGVRQEFMAPNGTEVVLDATPVELARKQQMCRLYASQGDIGSHFDLRVERYRPLVAYDYENPPHPGLLNYEAWQWKMTGSEVAQAFADFHLSPAIQSAAERRGA